MTYRSRLLVEFVDLLVQLTDITELQFYAFGLQLCNLWGEFTDVAYLIQGIFIYINPLWR